MVTLKLLLPLLATALRVGEGVAKPLNLKRQASPIPSYVVDYGRSISQDPYSFF